VFFALSKLLVFFTQPSNVLVLLGLVGLALTRTRFARAGWPLAVASLVLIGTAGFLPLGKALSIPLENRFARWDPAGAPPVGIVVLGGAINANKLATRGEVGVNEAAERVIAVPTRLTLEGRSRNTIENAIYSKALAHPKPGERWLLVTSALHMPRAIGTFRRAGFAVEAYPVDYQTNGWGDLLDVFGSASGGLARTDNALHEWIGLIAYRITGKTSELLPGPLP
jgi:uncharacterized SAM-binding protein YcdF (DUF218 family)